MRQVTFGNSAWGSNTVSLRTSIWGLGCSKFKNCKWSRDKTVRHTSLSLHLSSSITVPQMPFELALLNILLPAVSSVRIIFFIVKQSKFSSFAAESPSSLQNPMNFFFFENILPVLLVRIILSLFCLSTSPHVHVCFTLYSIFPIATAYVHDCNDYWP